MKHHFADFLDRDSDYWTVVPNVERYGYTIDENILEDDQVKVITITKEDKDWKKILTYKNLEELTLHEATKEQRAVLTQLPQLTRLRITHARPKDINFMEFLPNIKELVLEYVSGFSDLSPLTKLTKLRSLHLENLRKVDDFSGLMGLESLRYLYINGTLDWNQTIKDFNFLDGLPNLEVLHIKLVTNKSPYPALLPVTRLKNLKKLSVAFNQFVLKEYALLEVFLPKVEGSTFPPTYQWDEWLNFLGKYDRPIKGKKETLAKKRLEYENHYGDLKNEIKLRP